MSKASKSLVAEVTQYKQYYSTEALQEDLNRKVGFSQELRSELLCQAEIVSSIVEDMRGKIIDNLVSPENLDGCCYG